MRPVNRGDKPVGYVENIPGITNDDYEMIKVENVMNLQLLRIYLRLPVMYKDEDLVKSNDEEVVDYYLRSVEKELKRRPKNQRLEPRRTETYSVNEGKYPNPGTRNELLACVQKINEIAGKNDDLLPTNVSLLYMFIFLADSVKKFTSDIHQAWNKITRKYREAKHYLITQMGPYCSFCGLDISIGGAVEHNLPKSSYPERAILWSNFLLSCQSCNSSKGNKPVDLSRTINEVMGDYYWPDKIEYSTYKFLKHKVKYRKINGRRIDTGAGQKYIPGDELGPDRPNPDKSLQEYVLEKFKSGSFIYGNGRMCHQVEDMEVDGRGNVSFESIEVLPQKGATADETKYLATINLTNLACEERSNFNQDKRLAWRFESLKSAILSFYYKSELITRTSAMPQDQKSKLLEDCDYLIRTLSHFSGHFSIWAFVLENNGPNAQNELYQHLSSFLLPPPAGQGYFVGTRTGIEYFV
ncbi:MAG: hypothetical protein AAF587_29960 [Bacteroidota bacterium]